MNVAIIVLSDPKTGSEESLGRMFNALAAAYDFKQAGDAVRIYFHGTGTRWPVLLLDPEHPAHRLYQAVKDRIVGVSCGCADVFGARDDAEKHGFDLITDNAVPGTTGLPSVAQLTAQGFNVLTF